MQPAKITKTILKEAEDLYELIELDPSKMIFIEYVDIYKLYPLQFEEPQKNEIEQKLSWTRLSINSNTGSIVE